MEAGGLLSFLQKSKTCSVFGVSNSSVETAPVATTEIGRGQIVNESCKVVSSSHNVTEDKPVFESNFRRNTSTRGKKRIKEILQKSDAAGTTSDLYNAYKGPEEKKDSALPPESSDVALVSTPKLESVHAKPGSARHGRSNTEKKYSLDFLLKFQDLFTALPEGFAVSPDFASALFVANIGWSHHDHDSYPTPVIIMDRQGRSGRLGQGGNSVALRNPRMQEPIMSTPMQHVDPMGGMRRNAPDLERRQQKGLFSSPHTPMQLMHKAERKNQLGTVTDDDEEQERMKVEGLIPDTVGNKDSKEASTKIESMDVNGFHVLPSQVTSVRRLFERHPDIAVRFCAKNQLLRNSCMNSLLSLIETLCQPLQDLSNEDLVGADIALTYVKDSGFSVDWLEKKLDQVKDMKEKEVSGLAILRVTEEKLLKLKQKCAELEALAEEKKTELLATRTPLSFDDVV